MRYSLLLTAMLASSTLLVACGKSDTAQQASAQQQMPPSVVNVLPVKFETIPLVKSLTGRTSAYQEAIVVPQVTGIIEKQLFRDGAFVKQGQPLYRLNPDNYTAGLASSQANYEQALANINTAEASLKSQETQRDLAKANLARLEMLKNTNAISKQEYDTGVATLRSAEAGVATAKAQIISAQKTAVAMKESVNSNQLNMSRTTITAPMSGRTERSKVNIGTLATAGATQMVTITQLNPIYVDISQSSTELLALRQQMMSGNLSASDSLQVRLKLADGSSYPVMGELSFDEAKVDESTGTVTLRAIFRNDQHLLLPGMMVNAELIQGVINQGMLLPQSAINRTAKGETTVYVVDAQKKIQARPVKVNGTLEGQWIITDGLKQGENVVVVGGSKVKPDQQVDVQPYVPTSANTTAPMGQANQPTEGVKNQPVSGASSTPMATASSAQPASQAKAQ